MKKFAMLFCLGSLLATVAADTPIQPDAQRRYQLVAAEVDIISAAGIHPLKCLFRFDQVTGRTFMFCEGFHSNSVETHWQPVTEFPTNSGAYDKVGGGQ